MGKLGARELNFSSDINLIFVYGTDGMTEGENAITHFAYFARLAELVIEAIAAPTEDGAVFRVDLNLRPDGRSGPIVNSVRAAELYYQAFGRSWERNALVKARPAAGDEAVGEELMGLLEPFVWRRSLDLGVLTEIQAMKARIDARAGAEGEVDLKLGRGGIREVEFFVSALQLLHGGRERELRVRSVVSALDRLLFAGVVPTRDRDILADAYLFLRRAEHRVQMVDGRQPMPCPPRPSASDWPGPWAPRPSSGSTSSSPGTGRGWRPCSRISSAPGPARCGSTPTCLSSPIPRSRRRAGPSWRCTAASAIRTGWWPPSRRWPGAARPSRRAATRSPPWRSSRRRWRPPTPTRRWGSWRTLRPPCRRRSPTSSCSPSATGWRACSCRSSAPPTSSPSASCVTPSCSTPSCARTSSP